MSITLKKFQPVDWPVYKAIRLEALKTEQRFFGAKYEDALNLKDEDWIARLINDKQSAAWGLFDAETCIGLTATFQNKTDETHGDLIASYIKKEHRGRGLSSLYYQARIEWAREQGYKCLFIGHRDGNDVSKAANQKFGFKYSHSENVLFPDGQYADSLKYRLEL